MFTGVMSLKWILIYLELKEILICLTRPSSRQFASHQWEEKQRKNSLPSVRVRFCLSIIILCWPRSRPHKLIIFFFFFFFYTCTGGDQPLGKKQCEHLASSSVSCERVSRILCCLVCLHGKLGTLCMLFIFSYHALKHKTKATCLQLFEVLHVFLCFQLSKT